MITAGHLQDGILVADQLGEGRGGVVGRLIGAQRVHELCAPVYGVRGRAAIRL
jgi:hypothetical protein